MSLGSTEGGGYQPLIGAGGTVTVSAGGSITAVSIGNSGSGYRSGLGTIFVGVQTSSLGTPNITTIGTATISNGNVTGVTITNAGTGFTGTDLPELVIDEPHSYTNIPLVYSSSSVQGVGPISYYRYSSRVVVQLLTIKSNKKDLHMVMVRS